MSDEVSGVVEDNSPIGIARRIAAETNADVVAYNGPMDRSDVLRFVQRIYFHRRHPRLIFLLVTDGGDPDAAYKMMRYLHPRYEHITLLISGSCKSAGTLAAIGAHELAFAPYGELGPLDIQQYKTDNLTGMESGLTITEAIDTLARKAMDLHREHYTTILSSTGRIVSFNSAAKVATELTTGLFAPIFDRIDPYDVGQKARSMRIATSYGERLAAVTKSLKPTALDTLTRGYPSHSFVIDHAEAGELFNNVRTLTPDESALVASLGDIARFQVYGGEPFLYVLSEDALEIEDDGHHAENDGSRLDEDAFADRGGPTEGVSDASPTAAASGDAPTD